MPVPRSVKNLIKAILEQVGLLKFAFRLTEVWKASKAKDDVKGEENRLPSDGLPVPPSNLIVLVGGRTNAVLFMEGGKLVLNSILETLARHGVGADKLQRVLDFGCGCGRVVRYWKDYPATKIYGSDYNPKLVEWCAANLPFGDFGINELAPPLKYQDGFFDLVYAFSVFTHLPEALSEDWIKELQRVLKPGGHALLTTHGEPFVPDLDPNEVVDFRAGKMIVKYASVAGTNLCAAFHPEAYIRKHWAQYFEVVEILSGKAKQDFVLLRKR